MVYLGILVLLSLLILTNLLPIPVLDGGQIAMSCLEELFPRLVALRVPLTLLGLLLLAGIMIYANGLDVTHHWG